MKRSRELSRKKLTGDTVKRDKKFYLNSLDVEESLMTRAISLAERMFTAFLRENNVQVSVDTDDVADKILEKLESKLGKMKLEDASVDEEKRKEGFSLEEEPVIVKTEKMKVKGEIGKTSKSKDSIDENMKMLEGMSI